MKNHLDVSLDKNHCYVVTRPICTSKGLISPIYSRSFKIVYLVVKGLHDLAHYLSIDSLGRGTETFVALHKMTYMYTTLYCPISTSLGTRLAYLLSLSEFFYYPKSHFVIVEQVVGHGKTDPRGTLGWTKLEKLLAGFLYENIA